MKDRKNRFRISRLEERIAPAIVSTTTCVKQPGPTDTEVTTGTNPAGHEPPGHKSSEVLSNRECLH